MFIIRVICLFLFFISSFWSSSFAQDSELHFYSFEDNAELKNPGKSREADIDYLKSKLKIKLLGQVSDQNYDTDLADIPLKIANRYLFPIPGTKLYLFVNSKFLGISEPIAYMFKPGIPNRDFVDFEIDWKKLHPSKDDIEDAKSEGVLVAGSGQFVLKGLNNPIGVKSDSEITELTAKESSKIVKQALKKWTIPANFCFSNEEFKIKKTYCFKNDGVEVIEMKAPRPCGENVPAFVIVKDGKIIDICSDEETRNVSFSQYFKISGRKFLVLFKHEDLADFRSVYELKKEGAILMKDVD